MKHIYDIDSSKKSALSNRFIKCISEISPHFQLNIANGVNSQRSTHQNSARKSTKVATIKEHSPIISNSKGNASKSNSNLHLFPTADQRIERKNNDLFRQFVFHINDSTTFKKDNNNHLKPSSYIKPIQQKKSKQRCQSSVQIKITAEELYQHKYINHNNNNNNHHHHYYQQQRKENDINNKSGISTGPSKPILNNNNTDINCVSEKYYQKVYRDLSWNDLDKKRKQYNRADNIIQSFISKSKRDRKEYKRPESGNKDHSLLILNNNGDKISPLCSPPSTTQFTKVPNAYKSTSYSKNISTNISSTHLTSDKFDVNSYEEIHFLFVDAFQRKKKFLVTTSISKKNSIEID